MERPKIPETISAYQIIEKLTLFEYEALLSQKVTAVFFGFSSTNFQDDRSTFPFFFLGPLNLVRVIVKFSFPSLSPPALLFVPPAPTPDLSSSSSSPPCLKQSHVVGSTWASPTEDKKPTLTALKNPTEKKRREREL